VLISIFEIFSNSGVNFSCSYVSEDGKRVPYYMAISDVL